MHTAEGSVVVEDEGTGVPVGYVGSGEPVAYGSVRESTEALPEAEVLPEAEGLGDADLLEDLLAEADADGLLVDSPPIGAESCFARSFFAVGCSVEISSVATTLTKVMPLYALRGVNSVTPCAMYFAVGSPAYPTALGEAVGSALGVVTGAALADASGAALDDADAPALAEGLAAPDAPPAAASELGFPAAPMA